MDAPAAGNVSGNAASPILTDEEWKAISERFLSEHEPLTAAADGRFFIGWTASRAWWEDD
jgi:hypothetical protein